MLKFLTPKTRSSKVFDFKRKNIEKFVDYAVAFPIFVELVLTYLRL